jgi:hypothetical protein
MPRSVVNDLPQVAGGRWRAFALGAANNTAERRSGPAAFFCHMVNQITHIFP